MKFTELNLKNFGKLSDTRLTLHDGINLFYGENESGKSTTHTFIKSMLFGMERGKGRAAVNDTFSRYEPWDQPNFYAGTLSFESGGRHFIIERNFDKYQRTASLTCTDDGEELSLEQGDLTAILGGLTADNYENTAYIGQLRAEPTASLATELQNYATNYYATGQSDIDLDQALKSLAQKKKDVEKRKKEERIRRETEKQKLVQEAGYIQKDVEKMKDRLLQIEQIVGETGTNDVGDVEGKRISSVRIPVCAFCILVSVLLFALLEAGMKLLGAIPLLVFIVLVACGRNKSDDKDDRRKENDRKELIWEQKKLQSEWQEKKIAYENITEQIREMDDEPWDRDFENETAALDLAIERICSLSADVHKDLSRVLNEEASKIFAEITGGRYTRLFVDTKLGMSIFTGEKKVDIQKLSRGTIEQVYFSLRMAAANVLYAEECPVVLDDSFAYYDDERLKNTLRWLKENKGQVLLFTCHKREERILREL